MKAKPTPGPAFRTDIFEKENKIEIHTASHMKWIADVRINGSVPLEVAKENASLFINALEVYHETGLTPRELKNRLDDLQIAFDRLAKASLELKEQRDELLKALGDIKAFSEYEETGRAGCTYGDTEYDSLSAVYGYNQAKEALRELIAKAKSL